MSTGRTARSTSRLSVEASSYVGRTVSRPLLEDHSDISLLSSWLTLHHRWLVLRERSALSWEWLVEAQRESERSREVPTSRSQSYIESRVLVLQSVKSRARAAQAQDRSNSRVRRNRCGLCAVHQVLKLRRREARQNANDLRDERETRSIPSGSLWRNECKQSVCRSPPVATQPDGCFDDAFWPYPYARNGWSRLPLPAQAGGLLLCRVGVPPRRLRALAAATFASRATCQLVALREISSRGRKRSSPPDATVALMDALRELAQRVCARLSGRRPTLRAEVIPATQVAANTLRSMLKWQKRSSAHPGVLGKTEQSRQVVRRRQRQTLDGRDGAQARRRRDRRSHSAASPMNRAYRA